MSEEGNMSDTPKPGNIMSEPLPTRNSPSAAEADRQEFDAAVTRLTHAKDEAVAAVRDIVKARPVAAAAIAVGVGFLCGVLCRKRH
jgi:ElaB/YqjD/DUF883 family membrane-anchored ribosome-binding protein